MEKRNQSLKSGRHASWIELLEHPAGIEKCILMRCQSCRNARARDFDRHCRDESWDHRTGNADSGEETPARIVHTRLDRK